MVKVQAAYERPIGPHHSPAAARCRVHLIVALERECGTGARLPLLRPPVDLAADVSEVECAPPSGAKLDERGLFRVHELVVPGAHPRHAPTPADDGPTGRGRCGG